ncbi:MAG: response regulator, partial [Gammaproteobacteria bacterium]
MKVLIAEDDENSRVLLESLLIGHGHAVTAAADGQEALERALLDPPDLIVTDLLMPRLDGFGVCRYVRGTPRLKAIPIVVYTATYTDRRDEALALALGADRFVVKPVEPEVLVAILHEVLADAARRRPARTSTQDTAATQALHIERVSTKLAEKVTDLERERAALREGEARFRDFAELAADFFWETDASLTVTFATGPYATAVGRPLPELLMGERPGTGPGASATRLPHEWETVLALRHAFHDWPVRRPLDETHFVLFSGKP